MIRPVPYYLVIKRFWDMTLTYVYIALDLEITMEMYNFLYFKIVFTVTYS